MVKNRFFLVGAAVILAGATIAAVGHKAVLNDNFATMSGLNGVGIVIEKIDLKAAFDGLSEKKMQETVEKTLRTAGIPILSEKQVQNCLGSPYIFVTVNTFNSERALLYAFHVQVEFRQKIRLDRNGSGPFFATTWQSGDIVGLLGADEISTITNAIEKCTTEFTIAYLKGNQKN
jgi:hypothetical protein